MKRALDKILEINFVILLLVGALSFLRFSAVTDLFVPRKVTRIFSTSKALGELSFRLKIPAYHEVIAVDRSYGSKESLRFLIFPYKMVSFPFQDEGQADLIVSKKAISVEEYAVLIDDSKYKVYERK